MSDMEFTDPAEALAFKLGPSARQAFYGLTTAENMYTVSRNKDAILAILKNLTKPMASVEQDRQAAIAIHLKALDKSEVYESYLAESAAINCILTVNLDDPPKYQAMVANFHTKFNEMAKRYRTTQCDAIDNASQRVAEYDAFIREHVGKRVSILEKRVNPSTGWDDGEK